MLTSYLVNAALENTPAVRILDDDAGPKALEQLDALRTGRGAIISRDERECLTVSLIPYKEGGADAYRRLPAEEIGEPAVFGVMARTDNERGTRYGREMRSAEVWGASGREKLIRYHSLGREVERSR